MAEFAGIIRSEFPDWLGWLVIYLMNNSPNASREHTQEIQKQLDYEVKLFYYENN